MFARLDTWLKALEGRGSKSSIFRLRRRCSVMTTASSFMISSRRPRIGSDGVAGRGFPNPTCSGVMKNSSMWTGEVEMSRTGVVEFSGK